MIKSVVVESNKLKPLTHALALGFIRRVSTEGSCKGLFCFLHDIRTPYDKKHLHGWRGRKHRATNHPVDNPTELCARYRERRKDMVRQDLHRLNRNPLREVGVLCTWAWCDVYHPWGNYG